MVNGRSTWQSRGPCAIHLHNVKPPRAIRSNPATHMISEPTFSLSSFLSFFGFSFLFFLFVIDATNTIIGPKKSRCRVVEGM